MQTNRSGFNIGRGPDGKYEGGHGINYNRGVEIRKAKNGADVYMYIDAPGVYYNANELPVHEDAAASAGFPIEENKLLYKRQMRQAEVMKLLDEEFNTQNSGDVTVVKELGGYTYINIGADRYQIKDPDGELMSKRPMSKAEADFTWEKMVVPGVPVETGDGGLRDDPKPGAD